MADKSSSITQASDLTSEVVLKLGEYYSAQQMRKVQTGLTTAAGELRSLTQHNALNGKLGATLSHEQRELLNNAAALLDSIKYKVEHAKERKVRVEKAAAKKRQQWDREADQLVKKHFSLPMNTVAEQLGVLELYLVAEPILAPAYYLRCPSELRKAIEEVPPSWSHHTMATWRRSEVSSLLADLHSALRYHLAASLDIPPAQRLAEVQRNLEERRAEILAQPQAVEIMRVWSDALKGAAFIASVMPAAGPGN